MGEDQALASEGLKHDIEDNGAEATSSHNPLTGCGLPKITFQVK